MPPASLPDWLGQIALVGSPLNKYELFDLATQMEGHPDNIAPAIFGGLCVSFMEEGKPNMIRYGIKKDLLFVTLIPDYEVNTKAARESLTKSDELCGCYVSDGALCGFSKGDGNR